MTLPKGTPDSRIKANIAKRQELKKKWDRHCKYSADDNLPDNLQVEGLTATTQIELAKESGNDNWVRLLDEGTVVDGDGWPWGVIKKGTLQAALDAMPANFKGYIDKGHDREIFLGNFTKKDLRIVDTEDGRQALDVNLHLDHELYAVRDLIREDAHHALSVEMFSSVEMYLDGSKVTGDEDWEGWLVPVFDELKIEGFGVVRNPKSAYSVKDDMLIKAAVEEGNDMKKTKEELKALQNEAEADADKTEDQTEAAENEGAEAKGGVTTGETGANGMSAADSDNKADAKAEKGEDDKEGEGDKLEAQSIELSNKDYDALKEAILGLQNSIREKDAKIKELESQLAAKDKKEMSQTDRVAELLGLAQAATQTPAEGGEDKTSKDKKDNYEKEDLVSAYKAAFAANNQ